MTTVSFTADELDAALSAALGDLDVLEHLPLGDLDALHDHAGERLGDLYEALPAGTYTTPDIDAVTCVAHRCWSLLSAKRPWTVFTTCTGSGTWWVAGGEIEATALFARWLGRSPWERCGQCGDSNWHEVDVPYDAEPGDDATVITEAAVAGEAEQHQ